MKAWVVTYYTSANEVGYEVLYTTRYEELTYRLSLLATDYDIVNVVELPKPREAWSIEA